MKKPNVEPITKEEYEQSKKKLFENEGERFCADLVQVEELKEKYPGQHKVIINAIEQAGKEFNNYPKSFEYKNGCFYIEELKEYLQFFDSRPEKKEEPKVEKEKKVDKVKTFLQEDRKKYESLGCGSQNGIFYFGTKVFRDGVSYPAIVTHNKKLYVNTLQKHGREIWGRDGIQDDFGLNYKTTFYDESLEHIFSRQAITKWLYEDCEDISFPTIFNELIKILKKYIYLDDERKYSLLACYRIAGFFMPIWRARARLNLLAEMGSAKSRLTQIMHNTGFNSIALGDWTLPYMKAIIESTRGETHIDDFETLPEEQKNATIRLVKVGFMRGFKSGKMSDGNKRKPEINDLFNTTTLNNTEGLDFISADRCITIRIPKISNKKYDKEPNFEEPYWQKMRDDLYILGMKYPKKVKETYETITSEKIRGRLFFIIKPELTIAKLISNKLYEELENFWVEEIEQRDNIDYESDWEFLAFKDMYKLLSPLPPFPTLSTLSTHSPPKEFTIKEIINSIKTMYSEEEYKKKSRSINIVIGKCLSKNPIFKFKTSRGQKKYRVIPEELVSLLEAKRFLSPILDIIKGESGESGESGDGGTYQQVDFSKTKIKEELENE